MRKALLWVGIIVSLSYAIFMYWAVGDKLSCLKVMELNAVGDFLAGVFSPLAFLWLVLGFIQQGIELRVSSDALQLQADELKSSVLQQTELASLTSKSLKFQQLAIEPILQLNTSGLREEFDESGRCEICELVLQNVGATCEQVYIYLIGANPMPSKCFEFSIFEKNTTIALNIYDLIDREPLWELKVGYVKADGNRGVQRFEIRPVEYPNLDGWYPSIAKIYS